MTTASVLPASSGLVLRDRTNSDPRQVLVTAIDDLVACGAWTHRRVLRWPGRRVGALSPAGDVDPGLPEPLRYVDGLLRRTAVDRGLPLPVGDAARWAALRARRAPTEAVRRTIEDLIARGLLERAQLGEPSRTILRPTAMGAAALAAAPPPELVLVSARDPQRRRAAVRMLPAIGADFLGAWVATTTGGNGFAAGTVGSAFGADGHHAGGSWLTGGDGISGGGCDTGGGHHGGGAGC